MTFYAENETTYSFDFDWEEVFHQVALAILDSENCPYEAEVNLLLTDNAGIQEFNRENRNIDAPTDVLSFPNIEYDIPADFYKTKDIHVHFPEGAVPKDGPSAGVTVCTAIVSALTGVSVRSDVAMTGEISIRGRVMRIGGLREKTMAALRHGINTVIIPKDNERDLLEIDQTVRKQLNFVVCQTIDGVLDTALNRKGEPDPTILAPIPGDIRVKAHKPGLQQ